MAAANPNRPLAHGHAGVGIGKRHHSRQPGQRAHLRQFQSALFGYCDHGAIRFGRAIQIAYRVTRIADTLQDFDLEHAGRIRCNTGQQSRGVFQDGSRVAMRVAAAGIFGA